MSSPTDPIEILTRAVQNKQPLVLVAGQSFDSANDAILESLLARVRCTDRDSGWLAALKQGLSAANMAWISERFDRCVPSDAAAAIFNVAWSAVFTSSIDPRFARRFETRGRQPETVIDKDTYAKVPRSRSRPPIHYLFGKSDETVAYARAPGNQSDLARRLSLHATELLNRIAETATVHGLVVIAGYRPSADWMPLDSLLAPLSDPICPKVLWFGRPEKLDSICADEMIKRGSLIATETSLASAISQLEIRGVLDDPEDGPRLPDDLKDRIDLGWEAYRFDPIVEKCAARLGNPGLDLLATRSRHLEKWRDVLAQADENERERVLEQRIESDLLQAIGDALPRTIRENLQRVAASTHATVAALLLLREARRIGTMTLPQIIEFVSSLDRGIAEIDAESVDARI